MKIKTLTLATLTCMLPLSGAFAAAMDRSGQSISSFLQPNNYAEIGVSFLDADVQGREDHPDYTNKKINDMADTYMFGTAALKFQVNDQISVGLIFDQPFGAKATYNGDNFLVSNSTDTILSAAQLAAISQRIATPLIAQNIAAETATRFNALTAQQRVGAALQAQGVDLTTAAGQQRFAGTLAAYNADPATKTTIDTAVEAGVKAQVTPVVEAMVKARVKDTIDGMNANLGTGGTSVDVSTQNYSLIFGFKPIENFTVYAGPVYQLAKGKLSLRGNIASVFNGYDADFKETGDIGWLAGVAYEIPEIALKASLTYRSAIEHDLEANENWTTGQLTGLGLLGITPTAGNVILETPQSVNLDFQSGIMANTVAFVNLRWVDWDAFGVRPAEFGQVSQGVGPLLTPPRPNGFDVIKYSDDQWSVNAGIGRKINDKWGGSVSVGWDSGAGNPVSSLGPTEGYTNVGLAFQYSPAPDYFVGGGVKYFWLGDADAQISSQAGTAGHVAKFEDNTAIAYGLKMGYRF